jgi:hypothetical protein
MHDGTAADGLEIGGTTFMILQVSLRQGWIAEVFLAGFGTILRTTAAGIAAIAVDTSRPK